MRSKILLALFVPLLLGSQAFADENLEWEHDYQTALTKSHQEQKPLLLFFTGSDWSPFSMKMRNEVLNSPEFQGLLEEQFVFAEIDFPQHTLQSIGEIAQNQSLKKRFRVDEYPCLILLDPSEREIIRLGYLPESGGLLAQDLIRIVEQDKDLCQGLKRVKEEPKELHKLYQVAQELSRADAIEQILAAGYETEEPFFLVEGYRRLVEEGKMDSLQASDLRARLAQQQDRQIHFTVALIDFQELAARKGEPNEVIRPLQDYLTKYRHQDAENVWQIEMMMAQFYLESSDWVRALEHAQNAYESAPEIRRKEIAHSIDYIRTIQNQ